MKTQINIPWQSTAVIIGAVVFVAAALYFKINPELIDPTNDKNLVNQAFEKTTHAVFDTDDPGGDFYSMTHNEDGSVKLWASPLWFLDKAIGAPTNGVGF